MAPHSPLTSTHRHRAYTSHCLLLSCATSLLVPVLFFTHLVFFLHSRVRFFSVAVTPSSLPLYFHPTCRAPFCSIGEHSLLFLAAPSSTSLFLFSLPPEGRHNPSMIPFLSMIRLRCVFVLFFLRALCHPFNCQTRKSIYLHRNFIQQIHKICICYT